MLYITNRCVVQGLSNKCLGKEQKRFCFSWFISSAYTSINASNKCFMLLFSDVRGGGSYKTETSYFPEFIYYILSCIVHQWAWLGIMEPGLKKLADHQSMQSAWWMHNLVYSEHSFYSLLFCSKAFSIIRAG